MFELLVLHALYGSSLPMTKYLLQFCPPLLLASLRMLLSGGILCVAYYIRNHTFSFDRKHLGLYIKIILFVSYFRYVFRSIGLYYMPAEKVALMLNIAPFFAAIFSYFIFKEKITKKKWFALSLGFTGIVPLLLIKIGPEAKLAEFLYFSWPELGMLFSIALCCYGTCALRILVRDHKQPAYFVNGVINLAGGLLAIPTTLLLEGTPEVSSPLKFFALLILLTAISNVICQNVYVHLLKKYSVTFMSFSDFLSPIFTMFYSWILLGEVVTWHYVVSGIIIFAALYLYYKDELQRELL